MRRSSSFTQLLIWTSELGSRPCETIDPTVYNGTVQLLFPLTSTQPLAEWKANVGKAPPPFVRNMCWFSSGFEITTFRIFATPTRISFYPFPSKCVCCVLIVPKCMYKATPNVVNWVLTYLSLIVLLISLVQSISALTSTWWITYLFMSLVVVLSKRVLYWNEIRTSRTDPCVRVRWCRVINVQMSENGFLQNFHHPPWLSFGLDGTEFFACCSASCWTQNDRQGGVSLSVCRTWW